MKFPPDGLSLYKNDGLTDYFAAKLADNSLSHAYILEGPPGSGKHTLALAVAASMAGESAAKVIAGTCPDVVTTGLSGDRKTIGIDTVRAIKDSAFIMPNELDFKMYIVEEAHLLTPQAQNGLLKLLEEPPASVYFMLLCEDSAALLATVRSRAPVLKMRLFSDDEIAGYLIGNEKKARALSESDPESFARLVRGAAGSLGAAVRAANSRAKGGDKPRELALALIRRLCAGNRADYMASAAELPAKRDELAALAAFLLDAFRDMAIYKKHPGCRLVFYGGAEEVSGAARLFTLAELVSLCEAVTRSLEEMELNVNAATAQLLLLDRLWRRKHEKCAV